MPIYNGKEFLQESVASVINQTYKEWELLIGINGLSVEDNNEIKNIIKELNDDRIATYSFDFKGKVKTLNELVKHCKYDLICLLDVDDYWFPEKLEKQLPYMEKYSVVGTDAIYFGDKDGYSPGIFLGELPYAIFSCQNPIINSSVMLHKCDAIWKEEWEGLDDYNLWVHLANKDKILFNIPEVYTKHRIHGGSYYNKDNDELRLKLRDKLPKLDEALIWFLTILRDEKKWKL